MEEMRCGMLMLMLTSLAGSWQEGPVYVLEWFLRGCWDGEGCGIRMLLTSLLGGWLRG
jgi:hypothetical protein